MVVHLLVWILLFFFFTETVFKFKALKKAAQLAVINSLEKASKRLLVIWVGMKASGHGVSPFVPVWNLPLRKEKKHLTR